MGAKNLGIAVRREKEGSRGLPMKQYVVDEFCLAPEYCRLPGQQIVR